MPSLPSLGLHAKRLSGVLAACALIGSPSPARAALPDEIQVYDDSINAPREVGLELHVNSTPSSRVAPAYPGEVTTLHGLRVTGEFSYGVTPSFELGLYVPTAYDSGGHYRLAGLKLRAKWMPLRPDEVNGGWFAGGNLEVARVRRIFDEATTNSQLKLIGGHRSRDWLFAGNVNLQFALGGVGAGSRPDLELALKATRKVAEGLSPGLEYYVGTGPIGRTVPSDQQDRRVFAVMDVDLKPWVVNLGIGRGLTSAADKWTLKAIFEIPLSQ